MISLHCSNKELLQELDNKEKLFSKIEERIMRCPHCGRKGHYVLEEYDWNDLTYAYWLCAECEKVPSPEREELLNAVLVGQDEYWDYDVFEMINNFEYGEGHEYGAPKIRDFDPKVWNAEKHVDYRTGKVAIWEEYVERTIKAHIKVLDEFIAKVRTVPMLKSIFKEVQLNEQ